MDRLAYPSAALKSAPSGRFEDRSTPANLVELKQAIAGQELTFPKAVERVTREALAKPEMIAMDSMSTIARQCGVGTSTVSRLPHYLGFASFAEMRRFFQDAVLVARRPDLSSSRANKFRRA